MNSDSSPGLEAPGLEASTSLDVRGVSVRFGGLTALDDVSLTAAGRQVTGIIGPNGAGKTTLLNVLCGFVRPQSGAISFGGRPLARLRPSQLAGRGIARTLQGTGLFAGLTVLENVMTGAASQRRAGFWSAMFGLPRSDRDERRLRRVRLYSGAATAAELITENQLMNRMHRCLLIATALLSGGALARTPLVLLTDFGTTDGAVSAMKGVAYGVSQDLLISDLSHENPDIFTGAYRLYQAEEFWPKGTVFVAVVDPGVGTERRGIGLEVARSAGGTLSFVGPDNGLLVAAAEAAGEAPVSRLVELARDPVPPDRGATFDGRDVFAPAVAALCTGTALEKLGEPIDPLSLVRLVGGVVEEGRLHDGRCCLRTEVTWVDHFGNLQLAATVADARVAGIPLTGSVELAARIESGRQHPDALPHSLVPDGVQLRCVEAFGELGQGEFGLLVDANGHLSVVAGEASAGHWLNVVAGELLVLAW